jgi:hypothetical protein
MRKICFFIPVLFISCFFLSCDSESSNTKNTLNDIQYLKDDYTLYELGRFAGLDEDTEWQILQAYLKKLQSGGKNADLTINDVWVDQYYGSYCPVYLMPTYDVDELWDFLRTDYLDPKNQTVVAVKACVKGTDSGTYPRDVIINTPGSGWRSMIRYYDKSNILLWDKGNLYDMEKDADSNYLREVLLAGWDSRKIINRHNGLDFETDAMIREDIFKFIMTGIGWSPAEDYAILNMIYLGTYNGYTAITLLNGATGCALYRKIIDGVGFYFPYVPIHIFAWKEGEIYELDYLFEQGLITHEDIVEMAYFHNTGTWENWYEDLIGSGIDKEEK